MEAKEGVACLGEEIEGVYNEHYFSGAYL